MTNNNTNEKQMYRVYIELNTAGEVQEFTDICSTIPVEVMMGGKDENGCDWSLSAKSLMCSLVMNARLQEHREHTAHEVDWNTVYVECEEDIYSKISKFAV